MALRPLLIFIAMLLVGSVHAQVPSADQLEAFRNLPPELREQLMEQLGIDPSAVGSGGDNREPDRSRDVSRSGERRSGESDAARLERLNPILRAQDVILVEAKFQVAQPVTLPSAIPGQPPQVFIPPDPNLDLDDATRERLQSVIEQIRSRNPYRLDANGELVLPGFVGIPLAGLTVEEADKRLSADPALVPLEIKVTRLPLERRGGLALKPFGYDLFERDGVGLAPATNLPAPAEYIVGVGDELVVQLYGGENRTLRLAVGRDGLINFPQLGPIGVAGKRFEAVRSELEDRVARQMIGVSAAVSLGELRSVRVFVLGEARQPGSHAVSGFATITSALYASGGVKTIGSLRDIQLKRAGAVVRRLDLYDLLVRGDTSDDVRLQPGDVIFIPPVGATVSIEGEVRRPAIYELRGDTQLGSLLQLAGGLGPEADPRRATLERLDAANRRIVVELDLSSATDRSTVLRNGDFLRVGRLRPTLDAGILLQGHVYRPGVLAHRPGLRLSQVLTSIDELKPNADANYVLIRRELPPDRRIEVHSADLEAALRAPGSAADPVLMPRDQITVFDYETGRQQIIKPLLDELRRQSRLERPLQVVEVRGSVKVPGAYPLEAGMTVSDLVRAGGGLADQAYVASAEISRYRTVGDARRTELVQIDLKAAMAGDPEANVVLQPFDDLIVKEVSEWQSQGSVTLAGEVKFPGTYPIRRGESLTSLLARAGGLTDLAYARGAIFTREDLRTREQEQFARLAERLQADLSVLALQATAANQGQAAQSLSVGQTLLADIREAEAVGRLVIDLDRALAATPGSDDEILLRDEDRLLVPRQNQAVTVIGEVQNSTSHLYRRELSRDDYIELSGGTTRKADDGQIYVVKADGSVVARSGSGWFRRSGLVAMEPGDTVVVPLDTDRLPALPLWQAVTQILYNVAIAVAAVNSF